MNMNTLSHAERRAIFCMRNGHSRLGTVFFGYQYCGRCGQQVGDTLGGVGMSHFVPLSHVYEDPDCAKCEIRPIDRKHLDPKVIREAKASAKKAGRKRA